MNPNSQNYKIVTLDGMFFFFLFMLQRILGENKKISALRNKGIIWNSLTTSKFSNSMDRRLGCKKELKIKIKHVDKTLVLYTP